MRVTTPRLGKRGTRRSRERLGEGGGMARDTIAQGEGVKSQLERGIPSKGQNRDRGERKDPPVRKKELSSPPRRQPEKKGRGDQ